MEDVLYHYEQPYDPDWPLVCFDERPCFLVEEKETILPMAPGKAKRHHYEYKKQGACCVLLAFEPHTGLRYVEVRARRTAVDYAEFMHTLLEVYYPEVEGIRLVQDNLNTHKPGSFYQILPADQAFAMAQRFDMHYTPVNGSWLNMAEIEFAALAAMLRPTPTRYRTGEPEVRLGLTDATAMFKPSDWTFAAKDARTKMKRHWKRHK